MGDKELILDASLSWLAFLPNITLNDDDGLPNLICAECKRRFESLENHTEVAEEGNPNFHYTPLYYPGKFTMSSPNSDVT